MTLVADVIRATKQVTQAYAIYIKKIPKLSPLIVKVVQDHHHRIYLLCNNCINKYAAIQKCPFFQMTVDSADRFL